jgi:hypothetical protein
VPELAPQRAKRLFLKLYGATLHLIDKERLKLWT